MNAAPAHEWVDLVLAERLRQQAWAEGTYIKEDRDDWDAATQSYPARVRGVCRHKATWLRDRLGGEVVYGRRSDDKEGYHAALLINIDGADLIVDRDRIWYADKAPFKRDHNYRKPVIRTFPFPVAVPWWELNNGN